MLRECTSAFILPRYSSTSASASAEVCSVSYSYSCCNSSSSSYNILIWQSWFIILPLPLVLGPVWPVVVVASCTASNLTNKKKHAWRHDAMRHAQKATLLIKRAFSSSMPAWNGSSLTPLGFEPLHKMPPLLAATFSWLIEAALSLLREYIFARSS